ncbi:hypothetical protein IC619_013950 [Hazenella sp. IB182353]|uniref:hypothetical protein n=1 Tax=Polycladospora coralii TaxID=2771432 RepID=UPI0017470E04|nr:hypothetical protein [Polycladospora coralii]MBS7531586.1 hypothetical protein [Polycladospora coralii]
MRARNYSQNGWKPELALDGFFFGISLGSASTVLYGEVRGGRALLRSEGLMRTGATASKMGIKSPLKYMNIGQKYVTEVKELKNLAKNRKQKEKKSKKLRGLSTKWFNRISGVK